MAEALRYWLPKVIQAVHPWMSTNDIEKGTRWRTDIASELEQSSIGIICLTPENLSSAWLNFEAGALSKQQLNTFVCTFLYGLEPAEVREPLAQFQSTKAQREDVRKLIHTINNRLGEKKLPDSEINESFDVWWDKFEQRLQDIPLTQNNPEPQRTDREILEEVLGLLRDQSRSNKQIVSDVSDRKKPSSGFSHEDIKLLASFYRVSEKAMRLGIRGSESAFVPMLEMLREKAERAAIASEEAEGTAISTTVNNSGEEEVNENPNP